MYIIYIYHYKLCIKTFPSPKLFSNVNATTEFHYFSSVNNDSIHLIIGSITLKFLVSLGWSDGSPVFSLK